MMPSYSYGQSDDQRKKELEEEFPRKTGQRTLLPWCPFDVENHGIDSWQDRAIEVAY